MKLSGYYKNKNNTVELKTDYNNLSQYDKVFISKVFTDTPIDESIFKLPNVEYGGTGFFYDKAIPLPYEIEHIMPDYHLYDEWVQQKLLDGIKSKDLVYYTDYSIGFTTRGCFRKCSFCVNKNYNHVESWSPISEFYDSQKKKICLLDDNVLGYSRWKEVFEELQSLNKPFQFKQGLDERLLDEEKCKIIFSSKYSGDFIFAFDNIDDKTIVENKLRLIRSIYNRAGQNIKFYVLCGFDRNNKYDKQFWIKDINDIFERMKILMKYNCLPYIMRYEKYRDSLYYGTYVNIASWCNQPNMFNKKTYRQWCIDDNKRKGGNSATIRYLQQFENDNFDIASKYYDLKFEDLRITIN
jgi:hypothetical protein